MDTKAAGTFPILKRRKIEWDSAMRDSRRERQNRYLIQCSRRQTVMLLVMVENEANRVRSDLIEGKVLDGQKDMLLERLVDCDALLDEMNRQLGLASRLWRVGLASQPDPDADYDARV